VKLAPKPKLEIDNETDKYLKQICEANINIYSVYDLIDDD
jgi:hypothetical protein